MRRFTWLFIVAAVVVGAMPSLHAANGVRPLRGIHSEGGRLLDASGRTVILRGINVVDKNGWDGSLAPPLIDAENARRIADLGFNHLRLGTTWASIEHERGRYDEAYLDQFVAVLDTIYEAGLLAVVDMHQDVWSEALGSDGAPAWADPQCNQLPDAKLDELTGQWFAQYGSPSVNAAWANFWNDGYGALDPHCTGAIQTAFVEMWRHVAARVGRHPAVIGYDILNEPWPSAPPGVFEAVQLMPMYRRVAAAIRDVDPDTPIFFGPPLYSPALPTLSVDAPASNAVFAPHIYTETMISGGAVTTHALTDELSLLKDLEDGRRMGVPVWVGEWGAINDQQYIREMYDLFDRYAANSAFWMYAQFPGQSLPSEAEAAHVRIYPEAYSGEATWSFNADTSTFAMTLTVGPGAHSVSIVVPERLGVTTNDRNVAFRGNRAIWSVNGPGTFELHLAPG